MQGKCYCCKEKWAWYNLMLPFSGRWFIFSSIEILGQGRIMRKYIVLLIVGLAVAASGGWLFTNGSGRIESEDREVEPFSELKIKSETYVTRADFEVFITQENTFSLVVEADDNILPMIQSEVSEGMLTIWNDEWFRSSNNVRIYVSSPHWRVIVIDGFAVLKTQTPLDTDGMHLTINGNGRVDMDIETEEMDVDINGRGNIELGGAARTFSVEINGQADIDALSFVAQEAEIEINGIGDVSLEVVKKLDVEINGFGNVKYIGAPDVSPEINGSGEIERLDK